MNETQQAELFNRELDALLREGKAPIFSADPGAMSLAQELARADFSGESLIKDIARSKLGDDVTADVNRKKPAIRKAGDKTEPEPFNGESGV